MAPAYPLFYRGTQVDGFNLIQMEDELIGMSHPVTGYRLASHWKLSENLADAIRHHHCPEEATVDPALTHLVYLADLLMSRLVVGQELERLDTKMLSQRLEQLGLAEEQLPIIIDLIPQGVFQFKA
jgi:HD-like signal output (HDOD) protein